MIDRKVISADTKLQKAIKILDLIIAVEIWILFFWLIWNVWSCHYTGTCPIKGMINP